MIKITINNSTSKITGVSPDIEKQLKHELRYLSQNVSYVYHQNVREAERIRNILGNDRFKAERSSLEKELYRLDKVNSGLIRKMYVMLYNDGEFPTGLLPRVVSSFMSAELPFEMKDERKRPPKLSNKYVLKESFPPMRYYQRAAARLVEEKGRGIIVAPTGTGKTKMVMRMIWDLGVKTLIITPGKSITDNMFDECIKYFGKGQVAKLSTKSGKTKSINVCNIQALVRLDPALLADVEAVFIDEFHHAAAETYQEVNLKHLKNCYYRIGVTATNFRNDGSDMSLEGVLSEVLYDYSIARALTDKFLVQPAFRVVYTQCPHNDNYQKEYKAGIVENVPRNEEIADIVKEHDKDSTLVLVQQLEHGETLKSLIPGSIFLHGEEKDDVRQNAMEDFRRGKVRCLIGTSVIGEGVDLPRANVLVMAGGGKAKSQIMQNVGRVLRPFEGKSEAIVYDFTDEGSRYLSEHSQLRQEIYKMYDVKQEENLDEDSHSSVS